MNLLDLDDDWVSDELPTVFGMIGTSAVPILAEYLSSESHGLYPRVNAASSLERVGSMHPEARSECVEILMGQLERFRQNDPVLNGFFIGDLIHLKGREAIPVIREAIEAGSVDISIAGDLEDVEIGMGLRQERSTPRPDYHPELAGLREAPDQYTEHVRVEPKMKKVGRNDPCPCGSGKKFKRCCLGKG